MAREILAIVLNGCVDGAWVFDRLGKKHNEEGGDLCGSVCDQTSTRRAREPHLHDALAHESGASLPAKPKVNNTNTS